MTREELTKWAEENGFQLDHDDSTSWSIRPDAAPWDAEQWATYKKGNDQRVFINICLTEDRVCINHTDNRIPPNWQTTITDMPGSYVAALLLGPDQ